MAEPKTNELMEKIVSLCKRRGFIFQSSEIYGGINGFWDYGPLGAELKRNVKELWWNTMTRMRDDVVGLEATIIMSPKIWAASGHVETFADLMVECPITKKRFRADQVEAQSGQVIYFGGAVDKASIVQLCDDPGTRIEVLENWKNFRSRFGQSKAQNASEKQDGQPDAFWPENPIHGSGTPDQNRKASIESAFAIIRELVSLGRIEQGVLEEFAVLIPNEKHFEKAQKSAIEVAKKFYQERGINEPLVLVIDQEPVQNSQSFNPENGARLTDPRPFNLMFKTFVGPIESEDSVAYLRPETAQAIFAQFTNVLVTSRQKVPFGIAQMGKAFRNEVTPRNFTFRSREFEQMELEFFIKPDEVIEAICGNVATVPESGHPGEPQPNWGWQAWHQYWVAERVRFYEGIGLSQATLGFHRQTPEELAHYARACVDILFKFPFSKRDEKGELVGEELEGIAARSDFDLSQHQRFSGKPMGVFDEEFRTAWGKLPKEKQDELWRRYYESRKKYLVKMGVESEAASKGATEDANGLPKGQYIPHVIEPSAGVDRLILALIANAFSEVTETDAKGVSDTRVVMKFHPRIAPVKVGVLPLLKNKPELVKKAREVRELLRPWMNVYYDDGGAIGRRYARQDEAGTPFCVTIDFDTLGEKPELLDTVTLRDRDTKAQTRVKISELVGLILGQIR